MGWRNSVLWDEAERGGSQGIMGMWPKMAWVSLEKVRSSLVINIPIWYIYIYYISLIINHMKINWTLYIYIINLSCEGVSIQMFCGHPEVVGRCLDEAMSEDMKASCDQQGIRVLAARLDINACIYIYIDGPLHGLYIPKCVFWSIQEARGKYKHMQITSNYGT